MKILFTRAVATVPLLTAGVSLAQSGNMMDGGTWGVGSMGGYGGVWVPILVVILVVGIAAWFINQKGK